MALIRECAMQNGLDTQTYINLYNHTLPPACETRLTNLGSGFENQPISDGNVPLANMDYYSVVLTQNPDFDGDGNPDSDDAVYNAFRQNFPTLASGSEDDFEFDCDNPAFGTVIADISWDFEPFGLNDLTIFQSANPITSIFWIEASSFSNFAGLGTLSAILDDKGAIMVSGFDSSSWTISTISTPNTLLGGNGDQPFSGNRQWGVNRNQNGFLEIFTRAVDVAHISGVVNNMTPGSTECKMNTYYAIADATWKNLQESV